MLVIVLIVQFGPLRASFSQNAGIEDDSFTAFVGQFAESSLSYQVDVPIEGYSTGRKLRDEEELEHFIHLHGLGVNTEIWLLDHIFGDADHLALTVGVSIREEYAIYLLTYSREGKALGKLRVGGYLNSGGSRYEQWADVGSEKEIKLYSLFRYYEGGEEIVCTQTEETHRISEIGTIVRETEEQSFDCSR